MIFGAAGAFSPHMDPSVAAASVARRCGHSEEDADLAVSLRRISHRWPGGWLALAALPLLVASAGAHAQVATREGNTYGGFDHQPTAAVGSAEREAGVAPSPAQRQSEDQDLGRMNTQLLQKAQKDARKNPQSLGNPYGVQPGGVVKISPDAGGGGGGGGGGSSGGGG